MSPIENKEIKPRRPRTPEAAHDHFRAFDHDMGMGRDHERDRYFNRPYGNSRLSEIIAARKLEEKHES